MSYKQLNRKISSFRQASLWASFKTFLKELAALPGDLSAASRRNKDHFLYRKRQKEWYKELTAGNFEQALKLFDEMEVDIDSLVRRGLPGKAGTYLKAAQKLFKTTRYSLMAGFGKAKAKLEEGMSKSANSWGFNYRGDVLPDFGSPLGKKYKGDFLELRALCMKANNLSMMSWDSQWGEFREFFKEFGFGIGKETVGVADNCKRALEALGKEIDPNYSLREDALGRHG